MWTNFEACNDAVPASSQEDFELNVLKYLKDQPGLAGLLRYMPAGMLVRIHLGDDGRLHLAAVKPPKDSELFPLGETQSFNLGEGVHTREMSDMMQGVGPYVRPYGRRAKAFFYTVEDDSMIARKGQTKMTVLDYVALHDLIDTSKFTCAASFPIESGDFDRMRGFAD